MKRPIQNGSNENSFPFPGSTRYNEVMISCILLSAGLSSRFGSPKALGLLDPSLTVIERVQQMLVSSRLDEIVIVLGFRHTRIKPYVLNHKKIKVVYNKDYN